MCSGRFVLETLRGAWNVTRPVKIANALVATHMLQSGVTACKKNPDLHSGGVSIGKPSHSYLASVRSPQQTTWARRDQVFLTLDPPLPTLCSSDLGVSALNPVQILRKIFRRYIQKQTSHSTSSAAADSTMGAYA